MLCTSNQMLLLWLRIDRFSPAAHALTFAIKTLGLYFPTRLRSGILRKKNLVFFGQISHRLTLTGPTGDKSVTKNPGADLSATKRATGDLLVSKQLDLQGPLRL